VAVVLRNPSNALAFQVAAVLRTDSGDLIAPVLWSDNYIELMPGESRTLTAVLPANAPRSVGVKISGWNFAEQTLRAGMHGEERADAKSVRQ
jgi:exo-1,4-beta-D-glucosaminidase